MVKDVHTEHCCIYHGCKYEDADCTVVQRQAVQSYPCEECDWSQQQYKDVQQLRWFTPPDRNR